MPIELHPTEAEGYFLNLTSETPLVFVMWRPAEDGGEPAARPHIVTVSYNQAGRLMDGGERVDPVPMPAAIRAWMEPSSPSIANQSEAQSETQRSLADSAPRAIASSSSRWRLTQIARALLAFAGRAASSRPRARRRRPGDAPVATATARRPKQLRSPRPAPDTVPAAELPPVDALTFSPFRPVPETGGGPVTQRGAQEASAIRASTSWTGLDTYRRLHAGRSDAGDARQNANVRDVDQGRATSDAQSVSAEERTRQRHQTIRARSSLRRRHGCALACAAGPQSSAPWKRQPPECARPTRRFSSAPAIARCFDGEALAAHWRCRAPNVHTMPCQRTGPAAAARPGICCRMHAGAGPPGSRREAARHSRSAS